MSNISCEKKTKRKTDKEQINKTQDNGEKKTQRNKRFEERKKKGGVSQKLVFSLAMTDAICAPEEEEKKTNSEKKKLYNIDCVLCCDFYL